MPVLGKTVPFWGSRPLIPFEWTCNVLAWLTLCIASAQFISRPTMLAVVPPPLSLLLTCPFSPRWLWGGPFFVVAHPLIDSWLASRRSKMNSISRRQQLDVSVSVFQLSSGSRIEPITVQCSLARSYLERVLPPLSAWRSREEVALGGTALVKVYENRNH